MKKILTILLSVCVLFSCAFVVACSAPPATSNEINAQEYATAMQMMGDYKFAMTARETGTGYVETSSTEYTINGDKIHIKSVNSEGSNEIYLSKEENSYFMYVQLGSEWQKNPAQQQMFDYYKAFSATALQAYTNITFEMLTYDGAEKCYKVTQEGNGMSGTFKFFFENKKVAKLVTSVVNSNVGETINTEIVFTYNVAITLPDEETGGAGGGGSGGEFTLTADNYNQVLGLSNYDCVIRSEITGDMEMVNETIYNQDIICQKTLVEGIVVDIQYYAKVGEEYRSYEVNQETGKWTIEPVSQMTYESIKRGNDFNQMYLFSDWTYNATLDRYECAEKDMGEYMGKYLDAWFKVVDGKVSSLGVVNTVIDPDQGKLSITWTFEIEYRTEVLQLPNVEE